MKKELKKCHCGQEVSEGKHRCLKCLVREALWSKKRRLKKQKAALCYCGRNARRGHTRCEGCLATSRNRWNKRRQLGLCNKCNNPPMTGSSQCESCYRIGFQSVYGISLDDFQKVIVAQGGVCAMKGFGTCSETKGRVKATIRQTGLLPDHDHVTNRIRMALCVVHNHAIGHLGDSL